MGDKSAQRGLLLEVECLQALRHAIAEDRRGDAGDVCDRCAGSGCRCERCEGGG